MANRLDGGKRLGGPRANAGLPAGSAAIFSSCDRGHLNLYQPFLDRSLVTRAFAAPCRAGLAVGRRADEGAAAHARTAHHSGLRRRHCRLR
jgi:hypothetical protein